MSAIRSIRNLGPKTEETFTRAGITSAEDLREIGADAAYLRAILTGMRPHFIGYYALVLGLQGRPWNDCSTAEKSALRLRFDALCAQGRHQTLARTSAGLPQELAAFLDQIGVRQGMAQGTAPRT
tara:strand:- start:357 stop:731 length:375 start_codon:yes stop_codon:yes gene_type:complete